MADWSLPTLSNLYTDFLTFISNRLNDAVTMVNAAATNLPAHAMRWNRSTLRFEEFDGVSTWTAVVLDITGGGTAATTAAGVRSNLGLGTMATQNNNAVNIIGGSVGTQTFVGTIAQGNLGSGSDGSGTHALFDDQTYKTVTFLYTFLTKTANYTVTNADVLARTFFLAQTNAFTFTLPTITGTIDRYFIIIKNVNANAVTVNPQGGGLIEGSASLTIPAGANGGYFSYTLVADNTNNEWWII